MIHFIILAVLLAIAGFLLFSDFAKGWRTQIAAGITAGIGGIVPLLSEVFGQLNAFDWRQYVDIRFAPWIMLSVGIVFAILRAKTTTSVGKK